MQVLCCFLRIPKLSCSEIKYVIANIKVVVLTGNVANHVVESLFDNILILIDDTALIQV